MADAALAVLVFTPVLLTYLLKSNAALSYLTLCGSFALVTLGSADLRELTGHLDLRVDSTTLNLVLLILPVFMTLLLTRRAFSGQLKTILHTLTALCAGGLLALVAVPLLSVSAAADFANSWGWDILQAVQTPLISAGLVLSLSLIWFGKKSKAKHHK